MAGRPPFHSKNKYELLRQVKFARVEFPNKDFQSISKDAIDLLTLMLNRNVEERPTAIQVLEHAWIQTAKEHIQIPLTNQTLSNLASFQAQYRLQTATLFYISSQLLSYKETKNLSKSFKQLDVNSDGRLSKEEIINGFHLIEMKIPINIDDMMEKCDIDGNGFVDYNEFVTVTLDWNQALSRERLIAAFSAYDKDQSGKITIHELK